jgi:hypothetical protein
MSSAGEFVPLNFKVEVGTADSLPRDATNKDYLPASRNIVSRSIGCECCHEKKHQ